MKGLRKIFGWSTVVGALLLLPLTAGAQQSPGEMRVRLLQGDVQVRIADTGEWFPASINMPLLEGDELWVPEGSRASIQTLYGAHVRLGAGTAFQVLRVDRGSFQFHLARGHAYVLNLAPGRTVLQLDTPDATVRAFGSATFRIDVPDDGTDVSVFRGSVVAESDAGTTTVRAGRMLALGPQGYADLSPLLPPDEWQAWNEERDRIALARGQSRRYLPAELQVYSSDFDEYGRWIYVEGYGYSWAPTALVIQGWAPYRHGRWAWRGGNYVWVGYEPWGWAPYHYGRWAFVARIGWIWVPPARGEVFWGPGYVGWVQRGDYVAWVPLAPGEVYYGHGHYGPHSVNVTNVNVNAVQVNVYRNVNVVNSITVVHQTTFVSGRPAQVNREVAESVKEDFARRRNVALGKPSIEPVAATHAPVVRAVPEAKRPPAEVRKLDPKEVKQSRPLVREPERSTVRPEARPRPLEVRELQRPKPPVEKAKERREARPPERRGPEEPRRAPPEKGDRGGRPHDAVPEERRMREAPSGGKGAPEAIEPSDGRRQGPPRERVRPEQGPGGSGASEERGRTPAAVVPEEQGKQERTRGEGARGVEMRRPEPAPKERGAAEPGNNGPARALERGAPREAPVEGGNRQAPRGDAGQNVEKRRPPEAPARKEAPSAAPDKKENGAGENQKSGAEKEKEKGEKEKEKGEKEKEKGEKEKEKGEKGKGAKERGDNQEPGRPSGDAEREETR